jgi:uncharacterized protein with PIN domain
VPVAYIDSSCVVALAFGEPGARRVAAAARAYPRLLSSNSQAESAALRERTPAAPDLFRGIAWVHPNRALTQEIERVVAEGTLRGADLWHMACALFLDPTARELAFLTLDVPQRRIAAALGFVTP